VPVIFLHIPRTGGTTLTRIARRQYRSDQIYMIDSAEPVASAAALSGLPSFARARLSLVVGHASFGVHRHVGDARYCTLIRAPVERVLSHYRYAQQRAEHPMHRLARNMTLGEMLSADVWRDLSNGQCRALAGEAEFPSDAQPLAVLESAKANLADHFALWGLTERFAETLLMARTVLGWQHLSYAPENGTRAAAPSSEASAEVEAIRRHNALDIALYAELEVRFEACLDELVPDWPRQLARLKLESLVAAPQRRVRRTYETARLRSVREDRLADSAGSGGPTLRQAEAYQLSRDDAITRDTGWLRRWVVGGYDWQVGQKEWMRRRITGDHSWGRIADSFRFTEALLEPCGDLGRRAAYDVGCGAGHVSFALASYFERVLAVDCAVRPVVRAALVRRSSRVGRIRFVRADASRFDPGEQFDLILCNLMSHNGGGRLRLLHRLATLTNDDGWIVYAEEAQGYAPMEIQAAIADRDVLMLRTRLRQVLAGIRGDRAFRFFVAPTAGLALEAFGFEVVKEEMSWWRSLPASHRIWCRRRDSVPRAPVGQDADYIEPSNDLVELRAQASRVLSANGHRASLAVDGAQDDPWAGSPENRLAPLLLLVEIAAYALPPPLGEGETRLPPAVLRAVDSLAHRAVDWERIEDGFARFVDAVDSCSPGQQWQPRHDRPSDARASSRRSW
jgi:SAM-dependent methyltransferase